MLVTVFSFCQLKGNIEYPGARNALDLVLVLGFYFLKRLVNDFWPWIYRAQSQDTLIPPELPHSTGQKARFSEFGFECFKKRNK